MSEIRDCIKQIFKGIDYVLTIYEQKPQTVRLEFLYQALVASLERPLVRTSLRLSDNNFDAASGLLGITKEELAHKLIEYNLSTEPELSPEKQLESWLPYHLSRKEAPREKKSNKLKRYYIDKNHPNVYLTQREADCLWELLRENTYKKIGNKLGISHRTVEYYIHNVQSKLKCRSKSELLRLLKISDFVGDYVRKN